MTMLLFPKLHQQCKWNGRSINQKPNQTKQLKGIKEDAAKTVLVIISIKRTKTERQQQKRPHRIGETLRIVKSFKQ